MPTFKIMIDPRSPAKKDGTRAIVLRVTENITRNYIPLGLSVKPEHWDAMLSKFKRAHDPLTYKELNYNLNRYIIDSEKIISDFSVNKIPFSFNHFKAKFLIPKDVPGVFKFFDITIEMMKSRKEVGNAEVYYHAKNRLFEYHKSKEMSFPEMTQSFLEGFETYLIKDGCSGNTIHHYMRTIRALFYRAVKADYATPELNPFYSNYTRKGYRFSHLLKATSKRALSKADLQKLIRYQPAPLSKEENAKYFFLFSYYAWGMNIVDMAKLRWDKEILPNYIEYFRTKTRYTKSFRIPIIEPLREILNYCRNYSPKGYVFTILNDSITDPAKQYTRIKTATRLVNRILKEIGKTLDIETPLTTYVARHTFASVLKSQVTSSAIIKEMMGHTKEETTEIYLKAFENKTLDDASELLNLK